GVAFARTAGRPVGPLPARAAPPPPAARPCWDKRRRQLCWRGLVVKQFRSPAPNQELILDALQDEGWPAPLHHPLPHSPNHEPPRRLRAPVERPSLDQRRRVLRLRAAGNGCGVCWEPAG